MSMLQCKYWKYAQACESVVHIPSYMSNSLPAWQLFLVLHPCPVKDTAKYTATHASVSVYVSVFKYIRLK